MKPTIRIKKTVLMVLGAVVFAATGYSLTQSSFAATTNPYGAIDYCALEGNITTIYGWASDPNAGAGQLPNVTVTAGGVATTTSTDRANYRDANINTYIDRFKPGDPKPGTYGFRAQLPNVFKGNTYKIAGVAVNVGPGVDTALSVNRSNGLDGDAGKATFGGTETLPAACLADQPAPPQPNTQPSPQPRPAAPVAVPEVSAEANAAVTVGTLTAEINIPAGNASKIHLAYSISPTALDQTSADIPTGGADTIHALTGLQPRTTYYYQIIRSNDAGSVVPAPTAEFTTKGYVVSVLFANNASKPVAKISATLSGHTGSATSGKTGVLSFDDVATGTYTLRFTYKGASYSKTINARASYVDPAAAAKPEPVTLRTVINTDRLAVAAGKQTAPPSRSQLLWLLPIALLLIGLIILFIRRRAHRTRTSPPTAPPPMPPREHTPALVPPPASPQPDKLAAPEIVPYATHTGESLKAMVLRGMAEEARQRQTEQTAEQSEESPAEPKNAPEPHKKSNTH